MLCNQGIFLFSTKHRTWGQYAWWTQILNNKIRRLVSLIQSGLIGWTPVPCYCTNFVATHLCSLRQFSLPGNVAPSLGFCLVLDTFSKHAQQTGKGSRSSVDTVSLESWNVKVKVDLMQQKTFIFPHLVTDHCLPLQRISIQALKTHSSQMICHK